MYQVVYRKAKPIVVDGVEFPSIIAAAKMFQVPAGDLSLALREGTFRGKPIKYKNDWDVPERAAFRQDYKGTLHIQPKSEKQVSTKSNTVMMAALQNALQQKQNQKEMKMEEVSYVKTTKAPEYNYSGRERIAIEIDGKEFPSICMAAKYYNVKVSVVQGALAKNKNRMFKGMPIAYADKAKEAAVCAALGKSKRKRKVYTGKRNCPVICETTGKQFKTIKEAAKYAGVNNWTMSIKMEVKGQFIDKNGNVYKRLKPMDTDNIYTTNSDALTKEIHRKHKQVEEFAAPEPIKEEPVSIKQPAQVIIDKAEIAKEVLINKVTDFVKSNRYGLAKNLIDVIEEL